MKSNRYDKRQHISVSHTTCQYHIRVIFYCWLYVLKSLDIVHMTLNFNSKSKKYLNAKKKVYKAFWYDIFFCSFVRYIQQSDMIGTNEFQCVFFYSFLLKKFSLWKRDLSTAHVYLYRTIRDSFIQKYFVFVCEQTGVWCVYSEIQLYFGVGIIRTNFCYTWKMLSNQSVSF